ncbi:MAG: exopolysaccharide Pel transporter PelG [Balneolaceae bacterium]
MSKQFDNHVKPLSEEGRRSKLIVNVRELVDVPMSSWAVAATIESLGIRDIDAETDYGYPNVFELAEYVYQQIQIEINKEDRSQSHDSYEHGLFQTIKLLIKYYTAGLVLSMPMLVQIVAILVFEYALWAWLRFNEAQATVVAFGTITAFVITGGFIQVIGRLVSKYKGEENFYLAKKAVYKILRLGIPTVLISAALLFLINLAFPFYPIKMMVLSIIYMVLISFLLLSAAILFASELRFMILFSITFGTIVVIFITQNNAFGVYTAQWIGIAISTILMAGYAFLYYKFKIQSLRQELIKQTLPYDEVSYYNNYRFFLYGFFYFVFLFTDRILAWSTGEIPPPYIIWFNTPYELGMDWALISFVITIATLEFSINAFSKYLIPAQKNISLNNMKAFNKHFNRFYFRQLLLLLLVSIVSILVTYFGVLSLRAFETQVPEIRDFFANPITFKVFWLGSISYVFLVYGLLNSLFFFTLNRPSFVTYSMIAAVVINFVVGFLCSRLFGFEYATIGLLVGSFSFALITGIIAKKFFKHLDYYYYSAY